MEYKEYTIDEDSKFIMVDPMADYDVESKPKNTTNEMETDEDGKGKKCSKGS